MTIQSRFTIVLALIGVWGAASLVSAQQNRPMRQIREMLLLEVDNAATRKFATVQTHLRVGQIREGVELLQSIGDAHAGKLVAAGEGRYVDVQNYAQLLSAGLSADGLRIYREKLDPTLKPAFEAARAAADEAQLKKILLHGYCCSFSDDVLLQLGDIAWDAGEVWRARSYWEQLLPPPAPKQPGDPVAWLGYPDSDLDRPAIVGRLILATIQSEQHDKLRKELAEFTRLHSAANGSLAGKTGNLLKILEEAAKEAESWREPVRTNVVETFGGNAQRFQLEQGARNLGRLRWRAELKAFGDEPRRGFQQAFQGGPCYFPVVYGDIVFVNDDDQILAYRLQTGAPAWSDSPTEAKIYGCEVDRQERSNPVRVPGEMPVTNIGWPRFTMTISDGRLYARMGSVRPYSGDRGGLLTCLELAQGEGKLVWETYASSVDADVGGWIFEGSPVVEGGRVYVGLRRISPQPQSNVACFDALTGKLIWNRKICVGQTNPNFSDFDVNQQLLTWGEGALYYTTHMGAIAALDPQQGTIKWVVSYPRVEDTRSRHEFAARLQRGPLPAMFANGMLYTAPLDSDELLALDAETGIVKWKRPFHTPIQSLLGVAKGLVFASGSGLWALSVETGDLVWKVGDADPESYGFGRGLLVDNLIYWPTHEEIFVLDQESGTITERLHLFAVHGQYGGNLLLSDGHLIVAQPNGLAVFSDQGSPPKGTRPAKSNLTFRNSTLKDVWSRARETHAEKKWAESIGYLNQTRALAQADDEWMGRSLFDAATEFSADCEFHQAWEFAQSASRAQGPVSPEVKLALSNALQSASGSRPGYRARREGAWTLRFPASVSDEAKAWFRENIQRQLQSFASVPDRQPGQRQLEEMRESIGAHVRSLSLVSYPSTKSDHLTQQLKQAEQQVNSQPHQAITDLHNLIPQLETAEERVAAWNGVAKSLERQQAWGAAATAWKQMARVAPRDLLVTDNDRQISPADLARERAERPEYRQQQLLASKSKLPAVLVRRWQQTFVKSRQTVHPVGEPPAVDLACVLLDQSPLTCVNLGDGKARWQAALSHPVKWAGYVAERLVLATDVELRAVSLENGVTLWRHRLTAELSDRGAASRQLITLKATDDIAADPTGSVPVLSEFVLSGSDLFAALDNRVVQVRDAVTGELRWQFEARRGLAPGYAMTDRHVLLCLQSPPEMVVLDREKGQEVARNPADSLPWIRPPFMRDDGSVLTVSQLGKVESWGKPSGAWQSPEECRGWAWVGSPSQSIFPADVLGAGEVSLLVLDGNTLVAVDSTLGNVLWKTVLGTEGITRARSAICCDEHQVYVTADGMLRAYDLYLGGMNWERHVGSGNIAWNSCVRGQTVFACPESVDGQGNKSQVSLCDATSGRLLQRLSLPGGGSVQLYPTAHTTLLVCGQTLCGLGR